MRAASVAAVAAAALAAPYRRRFGGWSGGCAGRRACSVGGEGADVVARFVRR